MKRIVRHFLPVLIFAAAVFLAALTFYRNVVAVLDTDSADGRKTIVIDAGHGGIDGGALSAGGAKESDINLQIALSSNYIAKFFGVETVMTREDDSNRTDVYSYSEHDDLVFRVNKANDTENGVLLSIHQNTYPTGQPSGAQVIYADDPMSMAWAKHTHGNLVACLAPKNRRVPVPSDGEILILDTARCPAILVECGFMSNFSEVEKLLDHAYQVQLATVLIGSFLQFSFGDLYS